MHDPFLGMLDAFSEGPTPIPVEVTLCVDGMLISGVTTSRHEYMKHHPLTAELAKLMDDDGKAVRNGDDGEPLPAKDRKYLHLRDARYFHHSGDAIPNNEALWIRVRLAEVSAFHFGQLSNKPV